MQIKLIESIENPLKENGKIARCAFRCMVKKDGVYHIFEEDMIDSRWRIFKRTSKDGINLNPHGEALFPLGGQGSYDERGQADPAIIYDYSDEIWKMWFDAFNERLNWDKLGYATSADGDAWTAHEPVLQRGKQGEWDSLSIHHPVVLKEDKYYLYYSGCCDGLYNVRNIGLATSKDGISWMKEKNPVLTIADGWENKYIRPSRPILIGDDWFMFYWGFDGNVHSMGLAISDDLKRWQKCGKIFGGTSEHDGITASMPIHDGNRIRMWYAVFDSWQINTAEIEIE